MIQEITTEDIQFSAEAVYSCFSALCSKISEGMSETDPIILLISVDFISKSHFLQEKKSLLKKILYGQY